MRNTENKEPLASDIKAAVIIPYSSIVGGGIALLKVKGANLAQLMVHNISPAGLQHEQVRTSSENISAFICEAINSAILKDEWQLIENAPKNGSKIILAKYHQSDLWWICKGFWSDKWKNWNDGIEPSGLADPTHWKPIPTPPVQF